MKNPSFNKLANKVKDKYQQQVVRYSSNSDNSDSEYTSEDTDEELDFSESVMKKRAENP